MTFANKIAFGLISVLVVFTALAYGTVHQPTLVLFYIAIGLLVLLWAVDSFQSGVLRFHTSPLQLIFLAAVAYGFIQVIPFGSATGIVGIAIPRTISQEPFATQMTAAHMLSLLLFFAACLIFIDSAARLRKTVYLITIFGFIFAFFAILQSVLSPDKIYGIYETRFAAPFGSFVNRHNFAAYMEMTLAVPLGMMFTGAIRKDKRLLVITAIALMGVALLLSGSRGGLVAFLAEVFFLLIVARRGKSRGNFALRIALAAALILAVIAGAMFVGGETSLSRFTETAASKDVTTSRARIWSVSWEVIKNNQPFGAGFGAFGAAYTRHDPHNGLERVEQAHNDYLQVLADAGVVGLVIGALFLYFLFRRGRRSVLTRNTFRRGIATGALAGCFGILVHSIFDFVLHTTAVSVLFLMLLSLVVAAGTSYEDDVEEFEPEREGRRRHRASVKNFNRRDAKMQRMKRQILS